MPFIVLGDIRFISVYEFDRAEKRLKNWISMYFYLLLF